MRIIGIDYGHKRVGVASTDESGNFSLPRAVWQNDKHLLEKLLAFKDKEGADLVVVGESKNFDNAPNPIAKKVNEFKKLLEERGVRVVLHPEIFTTVEARHLQGNNEMTDASAAALLLKSYLESEK